MSASADEPAQPRLKYSIFSLARNAFSHHEGWPRAWIALAIVANGRARHGETLWALSPLFDAKVRVEVGPPCFVDPDGERLRG